MAGRAGVVGHLLAGQETVQGSYPCLLATLRLLVRIAGRVTAAPAMAWLVAEVVPHYTGWRYEVPGEREVVGRLALTALLHHCQAGGAAEQQLAGDPGLARALLATASTGDRAVQSLLEQQSSWEEGRGADTARLVLLSLQILHRLVTSDCAGQVMRGPVGLAVRAPPAGSHPHFLLTLAHYIHFHHAPDLAIAAVKLLAAIASDTTHGAPVSVLACLASSASAVRDQLLARLESSTEDLRLKIAIVELLGSCVALQPGLVQLLMDINPTVRLAEKKGEEGGEGGEQPQLVGEEGCLRAVLRLLALANKEEGESWQQLHLTILTLVDSLWAQGRILASQHLKASAQIRILIVHNVVTISCYRSRRISGRSSVLP